MGFQESESRFRSINRVLWAIMGLNLAVAAAKFFYGLATGSLSMRTDGIASAFYAVSNIVGIAGVTLAARPADKDHPYGHAKFETYASVAIGAMLVFAAVNVFSEGFHALLTGEHHVVVDAGSYAVMLGTLAINIGVSLYERRAGKRLKSEVLVADARHTQSDAYVSVSVVVGLVFVQLGFPVADAVASIVVGVAIVFSAIEVLKAANATLSDEARIPAEELRGVAERVPGVASVHSVRTRGTEGEVFVDLHVLVDPQMTVLEAHGVAGEVEQAVQAAHPEVVEVMVHIEPDTDWERFEGESADAALDGHGR